MNDAASSDRPKGSSLQPLRALWPFITPYTGTLVLALSALLVASASMLAMPVALRYMIDSGFSAQGLEVMRPYFLWFLAVSVVFSLFASLRYYLVTWLGERVVADIRNAVYARVIRMDPAFFEVTRTGEVLSRLTTDTTLVQSIAGSGLSIALRSTLSLLGGLAMLVWTSPRMAAYT
ncbi:MAG: ABC transporter transmembrane domain-containing protein, partial [Halioglobus sp.]|nr:ABC transporter transmembrane domain-containing protein [Halioglobus sp.]